MPFLHTRRIPRLGALLACLVLVSISAHSQSASPTVIRGAVLNSVTREPIARALVTSGDDTFAALTDDQGRFSFNLASAVASYSGSLHAAKPGFLDAEGSNLSGTASSSTDEDLVFTLTPESLIIGRVTLPSAGSFDRIGVELYRRQVVDGRPRWIQAGTEQTRSNGDFRFSGLTPGTYKLFTGELLDRDPLTFDPNGQQFGYPPIYFPTASDFGAAAPITLVAGQTFQAELTPTLQPYYPIKITIPNAQPTAGVNVSVAPSGHRGPGFSLGFDGESLAIDGMLPSGSYTVEAISYGAQAGSGLLSLSVRDAPVRTPTLLLLPAQPIPVNVKEEFTAGTDSSSPPNGAGNFAVQGSMTFNKSGSPILRRSSRTFPMINISLLPADDFSPHPGANAERTGNPDAALQLMGAIPGRYWLQVYAQRGYVASATSGGIDLLMNPLMVAPGGSSPAIDITLRDDTAEITGTIEGSAADSGRRAPPTVYCIPLPDSPGNFQQAALLTNPGEDTAFQCQNLPPGSYRVLAFDHQQPELEYRSLDGMRPYESKGPVVRLLGGQKESVRVNVNHE